MNLLSLHVIVSQDDFCEFKYLKLLTILESSLRRSKLERLNQVLAPNVDIDETVNYVVAMKRIDIDRVPG